MSRADELATVRTFGAGLKLHEDELRKQIDTEMAPGDRRIGMLPDGRKGGRITKSEPELTVTVTDPEALADWLVDNYPDYVKPVPKDWAVKEIEAASKRAGVPCGPGGEMDIPGVVVEWTKPQLRVYANNEVARAIAAEMPTIIASLALPRGEDDAG